MSDLRVTPAGATLGVGTALAVLLPDRAGWQGRSLTAASAYATAQAVDGPAVELFSIAPGVDKQVDRAVATATATLSWVALNAAVVPVLRRLPLPAPLVAVAAGVVTARLNDLAMARLREVQRSAAAVSSDAEPTPAG